MRLLQRLLTMVERITCHFNVNSLFELNIFQQRRQRCVSYVTLIIYCRVEIAIKCSFIFKMSVMASAQSTDRSIEISIC